MKKKIVLLIATACTVAGVLTGCALSGVASTGRNIYGIKPDMVRIDNDFIGYGYQYVVDKNTGVVYLSYSSYETFGITAALNADGTPITAKQLGIEY